MAALCLQNGGHRWCVQSEGFSRQRVEDAGFVLTSPVVLRDGPEELPGSVGVLRLTG
jgi:hypothetical protein